MFLVAGWSETCEALAVPLHHQASACCSGGRGVSPLQTFLLDCLVPSRTFSTIINNRPCRFLDSVIVIHFFFFCCCLSSGHPSFLSVVHHTPSIACFLPLPIASSTLIHIHLRPCTSSIIDFLTAFLTLSKTGYYLPADSIVRPGEPRGLGRAFTTFIQSPF